MAAGDPQYWTTLARTETLVGLLQAFLAGHETHESLQEWSRTLWAGQESPVHGHTWATGILMNLFNATERELLGDDSSPRILRGIDVDAYLSGLQRGEKVAPTRELGGLRATPQDVATWLGRETERHVLDGIGWCEYLQLASPGTGRVFVLERALNTRMTGSWVYADRAADALDTVRDLFETLTIDLADLDCFAQAFIIDTGALPSLTLWRQDNTGDRAEVASFTGRRKAEAALRRSEAQDPMQVYWIEDRAGGQEYPTRPPLHLRGS